MGTFANSEDPDEMLKNAAFHQGLHCLLGQNQSLEKELQYYLAIHQGGGGGGSSQSTTPHKSSFMMTESHSIKK